jgi:hypothetical protein
MSLAAAAQLQANPRGAIPWLRLSRQTALAHADTTRSADACFSLGNLLMAADDVAGGQRALLEAVEAGLDPKVLPLALMTLAQIELGYARYEAGVQLAVSAARAGAAVGNGPAFADGVVLAAQCQMGLGLVDAALETCDAGALRLREQGMAEMASVVEAQRQEILIGEGRVPTTADGD